ncbi:MAG: hypothetical protein ABFD69_16045 [Candidatus Sumerlaeia bacterium]
MTFRILVLSLAMLSLASCSKKPALDPSGFYLAQGGRTYLEIHRGESGDFIVAPSAPGQMITLKIEPDRFVLEESISMGPSAEMSSTKRFKPSATVPGDWDLVEHVITVSQGSNSGQSTLTRPMPSSLHRADRAALQYYALLDNMAAPGPVDPEQRKADNKRLLEIARSIVDKSPDDVFLRVLLLDALQRNRDAARLESELAKYAEPLKNSGNFSLAYAARMAARNLKVIKAEINGRNAWRNLNASTDLNAQWMLMQALPDDAIVMNPDIYFIDKFAGQAVPNLLGVQTFFRTMRVETIYAMLLGRPHDALLALTSLIRIGHAMIEDGPLINRLIGIATTQIATEGMKFYVLNVSDSARDLDEAWAGLEKLNAAYASPNQASLFSMESPMATLYQGYRELNRQEAVTRLKTADANFALLRMATAARGRLLAAGSFPSGNDQFAPYLTTPPIDPFTSATLLMISTADKFTAYSTGPDRDDDRAQVTYDPTNGTLSDGDIVCAVPRARKYPIPAGGLHAATAEDVRRQMPNGLPADVFATTKGRPLNIGQTRPLTIFSWGPDMDERAMPPSRKAPPRAVPEIQYDPTNGTNSDGDLIMTVSP